MIRHYGAQQCLRPQNILLLYVFTCHLLRFLRAIQASLSRLVVIHERSLQHAGMLDLPRSREFGPSCSFQKADLQCWWLTLSRDAEGVTRLLASPTHACIGDGIGLDGQHSI